MSRRRADRVVIHRLELGVKEREFAEGALAAFQFNKVATPIVSGMSDISFMVVLGSILALWFPDIIMPTGATTIEEVTTAIKDGYDRARERVNEESKAKIGVDEERNVDPWYEYVLKKGTIFGRLFL